MPAPTIIPQQGLVATLAQGPAVPQPQMFQANVASTAQFHGVTTAQVIPSNQQQQPSVHVAQAQVLPPQSIQQNLATPIQPSVGQFGAQQSTLGAGAGPGAVPQSGQQAFIQMAVPTELSHPNYFQQALLEQATASATAAQASHSTGSGARNTEHMPFSSLHTLTSSDSSTSDTSSSSSGSQSSVSSSNLARPTFQSMGPHQNMAFDL